MQLRFHQMYVYMYVCTYVRMSTQTYKVRYGKASSNYCLQLTSVIFKTCSEDQRWSLNSDVYKRGLFSLIIPLKIRLLLLLLSGITTLYKFEPPQL